MVTFLTAPATGLSPETSRFLLFHGELLSKRFLKIMITYLRPLKLLRTILSLFLKGGQLAREKIDPGYNPDIDPVTGNPIEGPYKSGYGSTSREVLIPAFIAAYTKTNPHKVGLEPFPSALRMMPNWRINFDGLSKFPFIQRTFRSVNISHQYRSTYQIGSYTTNLGYMVDGNGDK